MLKYVYQVWMVAHAEKCFTYQRRLPELTPCYKIVQEHLATFVHDRESEGRPLPRYIIEEFEAFLKCGILSHGFIRLKCSSCSEEKIVAYSCKKRGFCPSCAAKRMVESAAHLVDNVLPLAPYRQFVISFPVPLRFWFQTNKKMYAHVHKIVIGEIHRYYQIKAKSLGVKVPLHGTISYTQRFGSALNLNQHIHCLALDGVFFDVAGHLRFHYTDAISDQEVAILITQISTKVMTYLKKKSLLDEDGEIVQNPTLDPLFAEHESLTLATAASIKSKIAFGPNTGKYVAKIGSGFGFEEEIPLAKGKRCFSINGFSIHANSSTNTHQRDRLETMIQYMARGPIANERLEITPTGNIKWRLKTPFTDGTTHLLLTPIEFLEKLSVLIPPPKSHLIRWGGCFAAHSPHRKRLVLRPEAKKGFDFDKAKDGIKPKNHSWSRALARAFKIDVLKCESCGGTLIPLGVLKDPQQIARYLGHVGIDPMPPARAPPRFVQELLDFDQQVPGVSELDG